MTLRNWMIVAMLLAAPRALPAQTSQPDIRSDGSQILRTELARRSEMAIRRGVKFLLSRQNADGSFSAGEAPDPEGDIAGNTALVTLALLSCGESYQSEPMQRAIKYLKTAEPEKSIHATYSIGLRACVYAQLPQALRNRELRADLRWLLQALIDRKDRNGMYDYGLGRRLGGDYSNSQYGVLGVWYAALTGLEVPRSYWKRVEDAWKIGQRDDGGWSYYPPTDETGRFSRWRNRGSYASMTAAGAATLFITHDFLHANDAADLSKIAPNAALDNAMAWLGTSFAVEHNAGRDTEPGAQLRKDPAEIDILGELGRADPGYYVHYMLFGFERVGEASGMTRFGSHKWFDEGADYLIRTQAYDGSWTGTIGSEADTAYSLLFLSRGRAPVIAQKLQFDGRWNNRSRDVSGLTHFMRRASERHVNWQVISADATPAEFREAPMLYVASDQPLALTPAQKDRIKNYILQGGLLVCINEGKTEEFAASAIALGTELFPTAKFRRLPLDHAAYTTNFPVAPPAVEMQGLSDGVRELVVVFPSGDMTWQWHSTGGGFAPRDTPYATLANLLLYVTDRANPRYKGEESWVERNPGVTPLRSFDLARIQYDGNWDPEPGGWERLANVMWNFEQLQLRVQPTKSLIPQPLPASTQPTTAPARRFGLAHLTATQSVTLAAPVEAAIRNYVAGGGLLLLDAAGGSPEAAGNFDILLTRLFPGVKLEPLPLDHPIYTGKPFNGMDVTHVQYRRSQELSPIHIPKLRGAMLGGKLVAIVSLEDLSGGLVGYSTAGLTGYTPASATNLMRNIILWRAAGK